MQIIVVLLIFGLIGIILSALGIWFTRSGFQGIISARSSTSWPSTMGNIVSASVVEQQPVGTNMEEHTRQTDYRPALVYSYTLGGKTYGSGHVIFNDDVIVYSSIEKARAAIKKYPVGQNVQVYYDPENPAMAVLEPGKAGPSWRSFSSGLLCLLFAVMVVWMAVNIVVNMAR